MNEGSLKSKALKALVWNALQKYGGLIIAFGANIILARLLSVTDYGLIGILTIFTSIASSIADSGFASALIQKKNTTQTDYCTVFFWNISIAGCLYVILFLSAPAIGSYFENDLLATLLRVEGLIVIFNALCTVQSTCLVKDLKFKELAIRNFFSTAIGTVVGVYLVLIGYGIWGLVWQALITSFIGSVLLWWVGKWRPEIKFSYASFKGMFKFGSLIFLSGICNTLYLNIQSFIIGKAFSVKDLGYYSQAKKLEQVPVEGTSSVLSQVLFPVYATIAENRNRHIDVVRKNIKLVTFITFPLMSLLIVVAHPLILWLFTDKWESSIPMFQIICIVGMFSPVNVANTEIFRSIGAGTVYFNLQTLKRVVGLIFIFLSIPFGLYPMLWTIAGLSIVTYIMNLYCTNKYFGYSYKNQIQDISSNLILSLVVGATDFLLLHMLNIQSNFLSLCVGIMIYIVLFLAIAFIGKMTSLQLIVSLYKHK